MFIPDNSWNNIPFSGFCKSAAIELFSTRFRNFRGEYGDATARKLLKELYQFCLDTDQNIDTIRKEITAKKTEYRRIVGEMEPINEQKRHCKQQFKAKQLTENEYKESLSDCACSKSHTCSS